MKQRIVSWFSCGAASAVASKLAIAEFGEVTIAYNFIKEEHKDNRRFLRDCEKWFGQKVVITIDDFYKGSIYNVFETNYMRTPNGSPCTRNLKKRVREKFQLPNDKQILGYTVEEMDRINTFIDANNDVDFYPILAEKGLTKNDCLAMIDRAGIELPVMYKLGYPHNNCVGCVKGGMGYWNKVRVDFPDEFKKMADMERRKGYTVLKDKKGPIYLHDLDPNRGRMEDEPEISCGLFCELAEKEY
jgi:hypothetical protein